jgi:hypothetical protein
MMPRAATLAFLDDMFAWATRRGIEWISVPKRGRGGAILGRPPAGQSGRFWTFTVLELVRMLRFDTDSMFFLLGEILLQQIDGFPMGMPAAHPLAVWQTAWDEGGFALRLGPVLPRVAADRYVDDVQWFVFVLRSLMRRDPNYKLLERARLEAFDPALTMVLTSESETEWECTDQHVGIDDASMTVWTSQFDKNAAAVLKGRGYEFIRYQHYHSYTPLAALRGVLLSTLLRFWRNSTFPDHVTLCVLAYDMELARLGYPRRALIGACLRAARRDGEDHWRRLATLLRRT